MPKISEKKMKTCFTPKSLNSKKIDSMKNKGYYYFKDQIDNGKREICFSKKEYNKDEVDPYTTDHYVLGFRKLGVQVIGIGKIK